MAGSCSAAFALRAATTMFNEQFCSPSAQWQHRPLQRIEELRDAVYGAGLEATQISRGSISGSLLFSACSDVVFTSGFIDGKVSLLGPLSDNCITLGIGLWLAPGSRIWYQEVFTGSVGIFMPGDEHDALYPPGAFYAAVTLSLENLEARAAQFGLVLDKQVLGGTGIHAQRVAASRLVPIRQRLARMHAGYFPNEFSGESLQATLLELVIRHCARTPNHSEKNYSNGYPRIVKLARDYLVAHLHEPIAIDAVAAAAKTSRRTLFRAFHEVLGVSPYAYTRTLRLHRIRHDLAAPSEARCTIALIANKWGVSELGRLSGWYSDLFGELPSDTRGQLSERMLAQSA